MATTVESETGEMIVKRVSVPIGLEELMEGLAKEVLQKKPNDLYVFASEYFARLLEMKQKGNYKSKPAKTVQSVTRQSPKLPLDKLVNKRPPPARQLSRQLSIRGESPPKTQKVPTKKEENTTSRAKRILENKRKARQALNLEEKENLKLPLQKTSKSQQITPRDGSKLSKIDEKQSPRDNKTSRERSRSRTVKSENKSNQSTPRDGSKSVTRTAKSSTETKKSPTKVAVATKEDKKVSKTQILPVVAAVAPTGKEMAEKEEIKKEGILKETTEKLDEQDSKEDILISTSNEEIGVENEKKVTDEIVEHDAKESFDNEKCMEQTTKKVSTDKGSQLLKSDADKNEEDAKVDNLEVDVSKNEENKDVKSNDSSNETRDKKEETYPSTDVKVSLEEEIPKDQKDGKSKEETSEDTGNNKTTLEMVNRESGLEDVVNEEKLTVAEASKIEDLKPENQNDITKNEDIKSKEEVENDDAKPKLEDRKEIDKVRKEENEDIATADKSEESKAKMKIEASQEKDHEKVDNKESNKDRESSEEVVSIEKVELPSKTTVEEDMNKNEVSKEDKEVNENIVKVDSKPQESDPGMAIEVFSSKDVDKMDKKQSIKNEKDDEEKSLLGNELLPQIEHEVDNKAATEQGINRLEDVIDDTKENKEDAQVDTKHQENYADVERKDSSIDEKAREESGENKDIKDKPKLGFEDREKIQNTDKVTGEDIHKKEEIDTSKENKISDQVREDIVDVDKKEEDVVNDKDQRKENDQTMKDTTNNIDTSVSKEVGQMDEMEGHQPEEINKIDDQVVKMEENESGIEREASSKDLDNKLNKHKDSLKMATSEEKTDVHPEIEPIEKDIVNVDSKPLEKNNEMKIDTSSNKDLDKIDKNKEEIVSEHPVNEDIVESESTLKETDTETKIEELLDEKSKGESDKEKGTSQETLSKEETELESEEPSEIKKEEKALNENTIATEKVVQKDKEDIVGDIQENKIDSQVKDDTKVEKDKSEENISSAVHADEDESKSVDDQVAVTQMDLGRDKNEVHTSREKRETDNASIESTQKDLALKENEEIEKVENIEEKVIKEVNSKSDEKTNIDNVEKETTFEEKEEKPRAEEDSKHELHEEKEGDVSVGTEIQKEESSEIDGRNEMDEVDDNKKGNKENVTKDEHSEVLLEKENLKPANIENEEIKGESEKKIEESHKEAEAIDKNENDTQRKEATTEKTELETLKENLEEEKSIDEKSKLDDKLEDKAKDDDLEKDHEETKAMRKDSSAEYERNEEDKTKSTEKFDLDKKTTSIENIKKENEPNDKKSVVTESGIKHSEELSKNKQEKETEGIEKDSSNVEDKSSVTQEITTAQNIQKEDKTQENTTDVKDKKETIEQTKKGTTFQDPMEQIPTTDKKIVKRSVEMSEPDRERTTSNDSEKEQDNFEKVVHKEEKQKEEEGAKGSSNDKEMTEGIKGNTLETSNILGSDRSESEVSDNNLLRRSIKSSKSGDKSEDELVRDVLLTVEKLDSNNTEHEKIVDDTTNLLSTERSLIESTNEEKSSKEENETKDVSKTEFEGESKLKLEETKGLSKENTFVIEEKKEKSENSAKIFDTNVIKNIVTSSMSLLKPGNIDSDVKSHLDEFLHQEKHHLFQKPHLEDIAEKEDIKQLESVDKIEETHQEQRDSKIEEDSKKEDGDLKKNSSEEASNVESKETDNAKIYKHINNFLENEKAHVFKYVSPKSIETDIKESVKVPETQKLKHHKTRSMTHSSLFATMDAEKMKLREDKPLKKSNSADVIKTEKTEFKSRIPTAERKRRQKEKSEGSSETSSADKQEIKTEPSKPKSSKSKKLEKNKSDGNIQDIDPTEKHHQSLSKKKMRSMTIDEHSKNVYVPHLSKIPHSSDSSVEDISSNLCLKPEFEREIKSAIEVFGQRSEDSSSTQDVSSNRDIEKMPSEESSLHVDSGSQKEENECEQEQTSPKEQNSNDEKDDGMVKSSIQGLEESVMKTKKESLEEKEKLSIIEGDSENKSDEHQISEDKESEDSNKPQTIIKPKSNGIIREKTHSQEKDKQSSEEQDKIDHSKAMIDAVTTIQKIWRGFRIRKLLTNGKLFGNTIEKEKHPDEKLKNVHDKSAVKIQSVWRGYQTRKRIDSEENRALSCIAEESADKFEDTSPKTRSAGSLRGKRSILKQHSMMVYSKENSPTDSTTNEEISKPKLTEEDVSKALKKLDEVEVPTHIPEVSDKPASFYKSKTVEEPPISKKEMSELTGKTGSLEERSISDKDGNNNKQNKLTELESDVKKTIDEIMSKDNKKSTLGHEVKEHIAKIMDNNNTSDQNRSNIHEIPSEERPQSIDSTDSAITVIYNSKDEDSEHSNKTNQSELEALNHSIKKHEELIEQVKNKLQEEKQMLKDEKNTKPDQKIQKRETIKEDNMTNSIQEHVDLIDQVQNNLLDQISGGANSKFDVDKLRKEIGEAALIYKNDNEDAKVENDEHDQLLEYLNDFHPEETPESPARDLPDIQEEEEEKKNEEEKNSEKQKSSADEEKKSEEPKKNLGDEKSEESKTQEEKNDKEEKKSGENKNIDEKSSVEEEKSERGKKSEEENIEEEKTTVEEEKSEIERKNEEENNNLAEEKSEGSKEEEKISQEEKSERENKHEEGKNIEEKKNNLEEEKSKENKIEEEKTDVEEEKTNVEENKSESEVRHEEEKNSEENNTKQEMKNEEDDKQFCGTCSSKEGAEKTIDGVPLKDLVEKFSPKEHTKGKIQSKDTSETTTDSSETSLERENIKTKPELKKTNLKPVVSLQIKPKEDLQASNEDIAPPLNIPERPIVSPPPKISTTNDLPDTVVVPIPTPSGGSSKNEENTKLVVSISPQNGSERSSPDKVVVELSPPRVSSPQKREEGASKEEEKKTEGEGSVESGNQTNVQLSEASPAGDAPVTSPPPPAVAAACYDPDKNVCASVESASQSAATGQRASRQRSQGALAERSREAMEKKQGGDGAAEAAATKIQAGFRGYQVRKQLKLKNGSSDITSTCPVSGSKRPLRRKNSEKSKENKTPEKKNIEEESAVKIQAGVRGFLVRRRQKKQKTDA